jgi:phytanoyl-CoA hydroxylase
MLLPGLEELDLTRPLADWAEHGYARLGRVLDDAGLSALRERALDLMLGRVQYEGLFFQLDAVTGRYEDAPLGLGWQGPSLAYRKLEKLEKDPLYFAWLDNPLFARIAHAAVGPSIKLYRAILFNKSAAGGSDVPWHQDGGALWGLSEPPTLQIWTALDDAPSDGGCLELLPGSHLQGLATPLGGVVPRLRAASVEAQAIRVPVRAGEAILLHNLVWHRSARSRSGQRRMAFSACYMDAATRCMRKRRPPRSFPDVFSGARHSCV